VDDVLESAKDNRDKDRTHSSLLVYGIGDGGGGPTRDMIDNLQRMADCDGLQARIKFDDPEIFYVNLERDCGPKLLTWSGELYLGTHL
jgi:alpha-mannosidase